MIQLTDHIQIRQKLFCTNQVNFEPNALEIFQFQYRENAIYREYCDAAGIKAEFINRQEQIPFLPIQFFKNKEITTTVFEPEAIFESSGTSGTAISRHFVKETGLYKESFLKAFEQFYGKVTNYCILGLLPSYLERKSSSLVWMVNELIGLSGNNKSAFYLYDFHNLHEILLANERAKTPTLLFGVTYALIDFFKSFPIKLQFTTIIETGGMKGRKEELTRTAIHEQLLVNTCKAEIHSEYGMTELLSQAYSKKDGVFQCPPWMKIILRAEDDPYELFIPGQLKDPFICGGINIIDLANLYSCSFIATDDLGKLYKDGSFEVLGRLDNSDIRGCSLLIP